MSTSNDSEAICGDVSLDLPYVVHSNLFLALVIITCLAFFQKRKKKYLDCCDGRPGALVPVNMLDNFEHRWSFACSFGAITNVLISLLTGQQAYTTQTDSVLLKFCLGLLYAVEITIVFFPFFACLTIPQKKVGSLVGLCYTGLWSFLMLTVTALCSNPYPELLGFAGLLINLPSLLCLGFLTCKFAMMTHHAFNKPQAAAVMAEESVAAPYQVSYVRTLLSKPSEADDDTSTKGCWMKIKRFVNVYIYENRPHFKYTTRIVCTFFLVVTGITQLGTLSIILNATTLQSIKDLVQNVTLDGKIEKQIRSFFVTFEVIWIGTAIFSVLFLCFDLFAILTKYRMNLLQLYKGDYSFFPHNFNDSTAVILKNSMVFPGYQIAYKIWGFFILNVVLIIILMLFATLFIFPLILGYTEILSWVVQSTIIPAIIGILFKYGQIFVAKKFLLQDKIHADDKQKPLAVGNRRLYHIVNYFLFIANIALGIFSALFRLFLSFIWGVIFLGRIDRCVLVPGFETQDKGHMSYLGMLLVEHTHNNPTMRVFCQQLLETIHSKQIGIGFVNDNYGRQDGHSSQAEREQKSSKQKRVQKRWLLLRTLLNNPELIPLRSHNLAEQKHSHKDFGKIVQMFKTGVLGIVPASSGNGNQSRSIGNYNLRAMVANQQNARFQRKVHNSPGADNKDGETERDTNTTIKMDNELKNYASPDENC